MPLDVITADAVRNALWALRYGNPLRESPLLDLDQVSLRLPAEQLADTRQARAWALGRCLADAVDESLRRMRGVQPGAPAAEITAEAELVQLQQDLRSGSAERLDLALVHWRYLSPTHQTVGPVSRALGVTNRTVQNWLARGVGALTEQLRAQEVATTRSLEASTGLPPVERILVDEDAATRGVVELLGELQALAGEHKQTLRITPAQLEAVARYPAAELIAYRIGRIAEWSLPRYRLDSRFVELSLMVDLGEESQSGRWQPREERFADLRSVLSSVAEPAVVLLGPPGSGKSTLLRRVELDLSSDALGPGDLDVAAPLTFLVSLNQYRPAAPDAPLPSPKAWLAERWAARYPKLPSLSELSAERGVVYLLDGLNEMPHRSADDYRARIALWKQFLIDTVSPDSGHRAVIACRSLDYSAPLSTPAQRVPQVQIEPLADEKVQEFLQRYSPGNAGEIWSELAGTKVLDAVRWPFFLRLLVEAAADTEPGGWYADLPALFTSSVRRALVREIERHNPLLEPSGLLDGRDYERIVSGGGWRSPYELPERGSLFRQLSALASGMQLAAADAESSQVRVGYGEALDLLGDAAGAAVIRVGAELGLLDEDRAADEVMFQHQLLQEYFAARAMAREPKPELVAAAWRVTDIRPALREILDVLPAAETLPALPTTGWEETAILAAVMAEQPEPFLRKLMPHNLVVAGRAARLPTVRPKLSPAFLDELRWALVGRSRDREADLRARIDAGLALGWLGDPRFERRVGAYGEYLVPPMVAIPDGEYPIGEDEPIGNELGTRRAHMPRHKVAIRAYRIGRYPVTNGEFACFLVAGGYEEEQWWDSAAGRDWRLGIGTVAGTHNMVKTWVARYREQPWRMDALLEEGTWDEKLYERGQQRVRMSEAELEAHLHELYPEQRYTEPRYWRDGRFNNPSQPVVGVCWYEARAYCAWLAAQVGEGFRLPTEVEREAATRGRGGRNYAYGDMFDPLRANSIETRLKRTSPVGVFVEGDTPEGVSDLAGNVYEWTSSLFGADEDVPQYAYPYRAEDGREDVEATADVLRVSQGGSWYDDYASSRAACRGGGRPSYGDFGSGVRIVGPPS